MQGPSLLPGEPRGLLPEKILPQYLKVSFINFKLQKEGGNIL